LKLNSHSKVVELGSGDGRWIIALAKKYHCQCIGVEIDESRLLLAKENLWRMSIMWKNMKKKKNAEREIEEGEEEDEWDCGGNYGNNHGHEHGRMDITNLVTFEKRDVFEYLQKEMDHLISFISGSIKDDSSSVGSNRGGLLIIMYLFRSAMERISHFFMDYNLVSDLKYTDNSSSSSSSRKRGMMSDLKDHDCNDVIQVLSVGFLLPSFVPVWHAQVGGIRVYIYHLKQSKEDINRYGTS
jgi:hypothetical protein